MQLSKKNLRSRSMLVECWFCQKRSNIQSKVIDDFICCYCESYNGFDSEGQYKNDLTNVYHRESFAQKSIFKSHSDVLCSRCVRNQEIIIQILRNVDEDDELTSKLNSRYPLCSLCDSKVSEILKTVDKKIKATSFCTGLKQSVSSLDDFEHEIKSARRLFMFVTVVNVALTVAIIHTDAKFVKLICFVAFSAVNLFWFSQKMLIGSTFSYLVISIYFSIYALNCRSVFDVCSFFISVLLFFVCYYYRNVKSRETLDSKVIHRASSSHDIKSVEVIDNTTLFQDLHLGALSSRENVSSTSGLPFGAISRDMLEQNTLSNVNEDKNMRSNHVNDNVLKPAVFQPLISSAGKPFLRSPPVAMSFRHLSVNGNMDKFPIECQKPMSATLEESAKNWIEQSKKVCVRAPTFTIPGSVLGIEDTFLEKLSVKGKQKEQSHSWIGKLFARFTS